MLTLEQMAKPVAPRLPAAGPILLTIPGVSDTTIAANTVGPEILYRWPGPYVCSGLWIGDELTADAPTVANLRLRMQDASRRELLIDGFGGIDTTGGLALMGRSPRWHSFRRVIRAGAKWLFQVSNDNAYDVRVLLYFRLEEE